VQDRTGDHAEIRTELAMKKYALTPRTLAVYEEFVATDRKFSKGDGTYDGLKIWCVMEQLEHENISLRALLKEALSKIPHDHTNPHPPH
jgi:hypothetical protein